MKIKFDAKHSAVSKHKKQHDKIDKDLAEAWTALRAAEANLETSNRKEMSRRKLDPESEPADDLHAAEKAYEMALSEVDRLRAEHHASEHDMHCAFAKAHGKRYAPNENPEDQEDNYFD